MGIGFKELLVIMVIVLVLFGAKRIPELARNLGKGLKEFKNAIKQSEVEEIKSEIESTISMEPEGEKK
jgi:sec-independent protein translocase protein TatA